MGAKFEIDFKGLEKISDALNDLAKSKAPRAAEAALEETHAVITTAASAAVAPHYHTGRTEGALEHSPNVRWEAATMASTMIGFHLKAGGLPSIFLMYGTPRMAPDRKLYNAFFGTAVRKKAEDAQRKAMLKELSLT